MTKHPSVCTMTSTMSPKLNPFWCAVTKDVANDYFTYRNTVSHAYCTTHAKQATSKPMVEAIMSVRSRLGQLLNASDANTKAAAAPENQGKCRSSFCQAVYAGLRTTLTYIETVWSNLLYVQRLTENKARVQTNQPMGCSGLIIRNH